MMNQSTTDVVDSQLHVWDVDDHRYPWDKAAVRARPESVLRLFETPVTGEQALEMMTEVRVDAAILTVTAIYGSDDRYALDTAARHPDRFRVVGLIDPGMKNAVDRVYGFLGNPHALGLRVTDVPWSSKFALDGPEYHPIWIAAERAQVPIFVVGASALGVLPTIARRFPNLRLVLDHLGLYTGEEEVARLLPSVLALASYDNVVIKCTHAPSLSHAQFPFEDLWPILHSIIGAFGVDRVMWGSDITVHRDELSYREALDYLRNTDQLSDSEKCDLLGRTLRSVFNWNR